MELSSPKIKLAFAYTKDAPATFKGKRQKKIKRKRSDFDFVFLSKTNITLNQETLRVVTMTMIFST